MQPVAYPLGQSSLFEEKKISFYHNLSGHAKKLMSVVNDVAFNTLILMLAIPAVIGFFTYQYFAFGGWLLSVPADERAQVSSLAEQVLFAGRDGFSRFDRWEVTEGVVAISPEERVEVIESATLLISHEMSGVDRLRIIEAIASLPRGERGEIVQNASLAMSEGMNRFDRIDILQKVASISVGERESVMRGASLFMTPGMRVCVRKEIIQTVDSIPTGEREGVVRGAELLITPDVCVLGRVQRIWLAYVLPSNVRESVCKQARELITQEMSYGDMLSIVLAIWELPEDERVDICKKAQLVIAQEMNSADRVKMIRAISSISKDQRESVMERALQVISLRMNRWGREAVIHRLSSCQQSSPWTLDRGGHLGAQERSVQSVQNHTNEPQIRFPYSRAMQRRDNQKRLMEAPQTSRHHEPISEEQVRAVASVLQSRLRGDVFRGIRQLLQQVQGQGSLSLKKLDS